MIQCRCERWCPQRIEKEIRHPCALSHSRKNSGRIDVRSFRMGTCKTHEPYGAPREFLEAYAGAVAFLDALGRRASCLGLSLTLRSFGLILALVCGVEQVDKWLSVHPVFDCEYRCGDLAIFNVLVTAAAESDDRNLFWVHLAVLAKHGGEFTDCSHATLAAGCERKDIFVLIDQYKV